MNANNDFMNNTRIKIISISVFLIYLVILGTAFYYQVIGDQTIKLYEISNYYIEFIFSGIVKAKIKNLCLKVFLFIIMFFFLNIFYSFIKHTINLKKVKSLTDE
jgi:hypothetical protein